MESPNMSKSLKEDIVDTIGKNKDIEYKTKHCGESLVKFCKRT